MSSPHPSALLLSVLQLLFFLSWTVYVVFLPTLLKSVGLPAGLGVWIVLMDQALFASMDILLGFAADRVEAILGRLGPWIAAISLLSTIAFLTLPWLTSKTALTQALLVLLIGLWSATSSILRAPPVVLLLKRSATPKRPILAALMLAGVGVGGAVSPYLGNVLRDLDPRLPFAITSLTLWLTTLGLVWAERSLHASPTPPQPTSPQPTHHIPFALLLLGSFFTALGFQGHFFFNAKPQILQFTQPANLQFTLPIFWIGFNLLMFPGAALARRLGPSFVLAIAAATGGIASIAATFAPSLPLLLTAHILAGGAWGVAFMAGIHATLSIAPNSKASLYVGLWFSALSSAALLRVLCAALKLNTHPTLQGPIQYLSGSIWTLGSVPLLLLAIFLHRPNSPTPQNAL